MKRVYLIVCCCLCTITLSAQKVSMGNLIEKLESYADSVGVNNWFAAESFAYDLLYAAHHMEMYGHESKQAYDKVLHVLTVDYDNFVSSIKYDILNLRNFGFTSVDKEELKSIILLYREFVKSISMLYGDEYVDNICTKVHEKLEKTNKADGNHLALLGSYYSYNYDLIETSYKHELLYYIMYEEINCFNDLYERILFADFKEESKAQLALDCFDAYNRRNNPNAAKCALETWMERERNKNTPLQGYIERAKTSLLRLLFGQKFYLEVLFDSMNLEYLVSSSASKIAVSEWFYDINEFLRQLELVAMSHWELSHNVNRREACAETIKYFEFADSLITNNIKCRNGAEAMPGISCMIYSHLAEFYDEIGDFAACEKVIVKAEKLSAGEFDFNIATAKANILISKEKFKAAKQVLNQCLDDLENSKFNDRRKLIVYDGFLRIAINSKDYENMNYYAENYFKHSMDYYLNEFSLMPYYQRKYFWENEPSLQYMSYMAASLCGLSESCASIGYDVALFQKGLLLRYDKIEERNVNNSGDENLVKLYRFLKSEAPDSLKYDSLEQYALLYSQHPEFVENGVRCGWQDIQALLQKDEVAIEFVEAADKESKEVISSVYLLNSDGCPIYIPLCPVSRLEAMLSNPVSGGYYPIYKSKETRIELSKMIWGKIAPYLHGVHRIYFSPSGIFNQLNIEILEEDKTKIPMNQKYDIYRLSSTALILDRSDENKFTSATLIGDVDYDVKPVPTRVGTNRFIDDYLASITRGSGYKWNALTYAKNELNSIETMLRKGNIRAKVYTGCDATEEAFKSLSYNSSSIIHIATHGFYYSEGDARKKDYFQKFTDQSYSYISPLRRAGLVLAGGNHVWLGESVSDEAEDGVLTASEISNMNLTNTELLVLSACQTGLGEINSDGVYGIQRAFKLSGVKTIIMSLWEVDDKATSIMMTNFYQNLSKGLHKRDSFDAAVKAVKKWNDDPYYWAAFIMLD